MLIAQSSGLYNLAASEVNVWDRNPVDAGRERRIQVQLQIGDAVHPLDGSGGDFLLGVYLGGIAVGGHRQIQSLSAGAQYAVWDTHEIFVPAGKQLYVTCQSPNAGDSNVYVWCGVYDVAPPVRSTLVV